MKLFTDHALTSAEQIIAGINIISEVCEVNVTCINSPEDTPITIIINNPRLYENLLLAGQASFIEN